MNSKLKFALILLITITGLFGFKTQAHSADITINWGTLEGKPIFSLNNFVPGQTESRSVIVTNNTPENYILNLKGIKTSDTSTKDLSPALTISVHSDKKLLYGPQSLVKFFRDSAMAEGIFLLSLNKAEEKIIDFTVNFESNATNEFQSSSVTFDIQIGTSFPQVEITPTLTPTLTPTKIPTPTIIPTITPAGECRGIWLPNPDGTKKCLNNFPSWLYRVRQLLNYLFSIIRSRNR
jgi:hypothetical protein